MSSPIIVALDGLSEKASLDLAERLQDMVWGFKVNSLLVERGVGIVEKLRAFGHVFADPKLYDIPNTVANSVTSLANAGADLITIHASGGADMIQAAVHHSGNARILCVTALTSLSDEDTNTIYGRNAAETVTHLAQVAATNESHGIVCSPLELETLQANATTRALIKVVPGIRPESYQASDDQTRISTPKYALSAGATYLVIGRPIVKSDDPREAAIQINNELST